jgi:hypothetical protein
MHVFRNARTLFVGERPIDTAQVASLTVPTFNGMGIAGVDACEAQLSTRHLFADHSAGEIQVIQQ